MKSIVLIAAILRIILITAIIGSTITVHAQSIAVNTIGNSGNAKAILFVLTTINY